MTGGCPDLPMLERYLGGGAEGELAALRARVEGHAQGCAACRHTLAALGLLAAAESAEESALLDRLAPTSPRAAAPVALARAATGDPAAGSPADRASANRAGPLPARPRAPRWARRAAAASAALAAAASLALALRAGDPAEPLEQLQGGSRPLEMALSGLPYAPYQPHRGAPAEGARFDRALRRLLEANESGRPAAARELAALYLLRGGPGDLARADALLPAAGADADVASDRAALLFAQGDALGALELCAAALEKSPLHRAARFNRALLLETLGLAPPAIEAFEAFARDESRSPWGVEARVRAERLRAEEREASDAGIDRRRNAFAQLLAAATPAQLDEAHALLAALPGGEPARLARLEALARRESPAQLAAHAALFARYQSLRGAPPDDAAAQAAAQALVADAANDPLLLVPALQLLAFRDVWRGEERPAQELSQRALHLCETRGCDPISEGIAADELAEAAGRDGDFSSAHRLQARAERLFREAGARLQTGELEQKQAHLFLEEGRLAEAGQAALAALRTLGAAPDERGRTASASAAAAAAGVASARHLLRAELELHRAALARLGPDTSPQLASELISQQALDQTALGRSRAASSLLRAELDRQLAAGAPQMAGRLRAALAQLEAEQGDSAGALADSAQALSALEANGAGLAWGAEVAQLHLLHARSLLTVRGEAGAQEARGELQASVAGASRAARSSGDLQSQLALLQPGTAAALELAQLGAREHRPAAELLAPFDELRSVIYRSAALGAAAVQPSTALAAALAGALEADARAQRPARCLVALLPAEAALVRLSFAPGLAEAQALSALPRAQLDSQLAALRSAADPDGRAAAARRLASALFAQLPDACAHADELWLWAEAPLDSIDLTALPLPAPLGAAALGMATTVARLLATEPSWPPRAGTALLADGAAPSSEAGPALPSLPASAQERPVLAAALGAELLELSGPGLTPAALLERMPSLSFLHASVHGLAASAGGGALQLSGELGRLSAREIAASQLAPGARVVLSACRAAPAESGLSLAFARAGALEIAAASGDLDDAAAARWAATFYPALARGLSFARANREAQRAQPAGEARAWFVITR